MSVYVGIDVHRKRSQVVYFADPCAPWQRGSNENTNGLLREYLPKGTDITRTPAELQAIADQLNDRPRKRLGYHTPREALVKLLTDDLQRVATTPESAPVCFPSDFESWKNQGDGKNLGR